MSSFKKGLPQREHRERSQLKSREKYGLLEKHKDYVLRAKDYHFKETRLKALRERARNKNEDEFYFAMEKQRTKEGIPIAQRNVKFTKEFLLLLKTQNAKYIQMQININNNRIEKLQEMTGIYGLEDLERKEQDGSGEEDDSFDFLNQEESTNEIQDPKAKHVIFVDNDEQVGNFEPSEYFDTPKELVGRDNNRVRRSQVSKNAENFYISKKALKKISVERGRMIRELALRLERKDQLGKVLRELEIQKALTTKGRRVKIGVDDLGCNVYKWKPDRKR